MKLARQINAPHIGQIDLSDIPPVVYQTAAQRIAADKRAARRWHASRRQVRRKNGH